MSDNLDAMEGATESLLGANKRHQVRNIVVTNRKTESRRSLRNAIKCINPLALGDVS